METVDIIIDAYITANTSLVQECLSILKEFKKEKNIDWINKRGLTSEEEKEIDKILIEKTAKYIKIYDKYGKLHMNHLGYYFYVQFED